MPTYDYRCGANGRTVEVKHPMNDQINTWGELCARANIEVGDTSVDAPVQRLATGGQILKSQNRGEASSPCGLPACCKNGTYGIG